MPCHLRNPAKRPFFLVRFSFTLRGHLLPQSGSFDAPLAETSIESERTLHTFEHRLSFKTSRLRGHPCESCFSIFFATCLGLASSNAILMSKLAKHIVGRITLPCFKMGPLSSCHSKFLCSKIVAITCKYWQFIPLIPPTCNFFQISSFFFETQNNGGRVPLRHFLCERKGPVTSDPSVWFRIWFS